MESSPGHRSKIAAPELVPIADAIIGLKENSLPSLVDKLI